MPHSQGEMLDGRTWHALLPTKHVRFCTQDDCTFPLRVASSMQEKCCFVAYYTIIRASTMKQSEWTLLHFDSCHESSSGGFVSAPWLHSAIVLRFTTERIQLATGCRIIEIDIRGIEADTRQVEHMRMRLHTVVCVITVDHVQVKTSAQLAEHNFFVSVEEIHVNPSFFRLVMNVVTSMFSAHARL